MGEREVALGGSRLWSCPWLAGKQLLTTDTPNEWERRSIGLPARLANMETYTTRATTGRGFGRGEIENEDVWCSNNKDPKGRQQEQTGTKQKAQKEKTKKEKRTKKGGKVGGKMG